MKANSMSDKKNTSGEERANHSSFVEHLRLIHFTLSVTCLIAIIAVGAKTSSSAQRAYYQSNLLLKLQARWENGKWLDTVAAKRTVQDPVFEATVEVEGSKPQSIVFVPGSIGARYLWFAFAKKDKERHTALKPNVGASFKNIEDAKTIWDMLNEFQYVVIVQQVHDGWVIRPNSGTEGSLVVAAKLNGGRPAPIANRRITTERSIRAYWLIEPDDVDRFTTLQDVPTVKFRKQNESQRRAALELMKNHKATCYFIANFEDFGDGFGYLLVPADCKIERIDLPKMFGDPEIPVGDFAHAFPDASDLGKNLKTLSLSELRDYFQAEQGRTSDKVELPLVKLPADSLAYWGSAIILLLTAYWFAVLRDFGLRVTPDDKAWDTPWIGISREYWSRRLFVATALLPPCTAAYLIFFGLGSFFGWELGAVLAIGAFVIVGAPVAGIVFLWRKLTTQSYSRVPLSAETEW